MLTIWALCHATLNYGGATSTGERSAIAHIKSETTLRTTYDVLCLGHAIVTPISIHEKRVSVF